MSAWSYSLYFVDRYSLDDSIDRLCFILGIENPLAPQSLLGGIIFGTQNPGVSAFNSRDQLSQYSLNVMLLGLNLVECCSVLVRQTFNHVLVHICLGRVCFGLCAKEIDLFVKFLIFFVAHLIKF